jgi:hypothetical protein
MLCIPCIYWYLVFLWSFHGIPYSETSFYKSLSSNWSFWDHENSITSKMRTLCMASASSISQDHQLKWTKFMQCKDSLSCSLLTTKSREFDPFLRHRHWTLTHSTFGKIWRVYEILWILCDWVRQKHPFGSLTYSHNL